MGAGIRRERSMFAMRPERHFVDANSEPVTDILGQFWRPVVAQRTAAPKTKRRRPASQ
jgi:hypothetical protein